jgi:hypothetical protein
VSDVPTYFMSEKGTYIPANRKAHAHLTILSEELPAAEISRVLGIEPDKSWRRGERLHKSSPRQKRHGWELGSGLSDDASVNDHLGAMLGRLAPAVESLHELTSEPGVTAMLWLVEHIENWNPGLTISSDELESLARTGVELAIDIYVYGPGELAPIQIPQRGPTREEGA